jgi:hypothetical protein
LTKAYAIAKEKDLYEDGEIVKIRFSVYSTDDIYKQMYEYVRGQLEQAAAGTPLEGKIQLEMFADADYYNSLYAGATDVMSKSLGSNTSVNVVRATFEAVKGLMDARVVAKNRSKTLKDLWG